MTDEELDRLVHQGDKHELVDALAPLDEPQRKKLAKTAAALLRTASAAYTGTLREAMDSGRSISMADPGITNADAFKAAAELAVLGLCAWTQARRATPRFWEAKNNGENNPVSRLLLARRPEWIDRWVQQQLDGQMCDWVTVRRLVREGACTAVTTDAYIVWMIRTHAGWWAHRTPLVEALRRDRGLLEKEVWQIFEVDLGRHGVLAFDNDTSHPASWCGALVALANAGDLDRARLLTASLTALNREVQATNASWFYRFHEALTPTPDERIELQPLYMDLLASALPAVTGFALNALRTVAQSGKLDVERFGTSLGPVFDMRPKTHPATAVKVLRLAAKQAPHLSSRIAMEASRGLAHAAPDVQKACLDLIESLVAGADADLAEALETKLELAAASQKPRICAILAKVKIAGASPNAIIESADQRPAQGLFSDAEIDAIPAYLREMAGIDPCLSALKNDGQLPRLDIKAMSVPRLDPAAMLVPLKNLQELIERASAAVEELNDSDELELLLDGMSRFAGQRPDDFTVRTAPLLKRLEDILRQDTWGAGRQEAHARFRLLVQAWLRKQPLGPPPGKADWLPPIDFVSARMERLSRRFMSGTAGPLLACPTHRGGWLDPRQLVRRLREWEDRAARSEAAPGSVNEHGVADVFDLTQALLRLAPDCRPDALADAGMLQREAGAAVRFALGADELIGPQAGLWIAAHRARDPWGTFPALAEAHGDLGPDAAVPASSAWNTHREHPVYGRARLDVSTTPTVTREQCLIDRPLAMLSRHPPVTFVLTTIPNIRCESTIWPANPDSFLADGAMQIVGRLHEAPSTFSPTAPYLEPLFDGDTPFSEMAQLALAVGLLAKDPGTRGLAVDALICLIGDGRCAGAELGPVYGKLSREKGMVHLNRLADSLADAARVSPLHQHVVIRVITATLTAIGTPAPADVRHLLTPLHEWLVATGEALSPECQPVLESVSGAGKTAALAATLLKQTDRGNRDHRRAALAEAVRGRILRAKRWMEREWQPSDRGAAASAAGFAVTRAADGG